LRFHILRFFGSLPFSSVFQPVIRQSAVLCACTCDCRIFGLAVYGKPFGDDAFDEADKADQKAFDFDKNARKR
jgi:hypothetical protein